MSITYSNEELNSLGWAQNIPYQTHQAKAYDPLTNSINIAVGDAFDLRNGYKLSVKEDYIHIEHEGKEYMPMLLRLRIHFFSVFPYGMSIIKIGDCLTKEGRFTEHVHSESGDGRF